MMISLVLMEDGRIGQSDAVIRIMPMTYYCGNCNQFPSKSTRPTTQCFQLRFVTDSGDNPYNHYWGRNDRFAAVSSVEIMIEEVSMKNNIFLAVSLLIVVVVMFAVLVAREWKKDRNDTYI
jgi:hypothetical protein